MMLTNLCNTSYFQTIILLSDGKAGSIEGFSVNWFNWDKFLLKGQLEPFSNYAPTVINTKHKYQKRVCNLKRDPFLHHRSYQSRFSPKLSLKQLFLTHYPFFQEVSISKKKKNEENENEE